MGLLRRAFLLLAVALLALGWSGAGARGAESGVVVNGPAGLGPQAWGPIAGLGVPWVRAFVPWNNLEPARGQLSAGEVASLEAGIAGLPPGTKTILDVVDSPQWASGSANPATPPRDPGDYARFVGRLAQRLGGRVAAYEIWNEEDAPLWWSTGPDPARYAALLKAAHRAIKAAEPHATVVLGGLTGNDYEFLSQLYGHGAKGSFDAVGVHTDSICNTRSPYDALYNGRTDRRINRWAFLGYRTVHEDMLAHGDHGAIWMTELGWSTSKEVCPDGASAGKTVAGVDEQTQATFLSQAYHCLAQDPYVRVGIWFGLKDTEPFGSARGSYGLLDQDLAPKPAYYALAGYAHSGDRLGEPCAVPGPTVTLLRPKTGARYSGSLPIAVTASSRSPVYEISLFWDGHLIRNFYIHDGLPTLSGRMKWFGARFISAGKHRLAATAIDMRNNVGSTSIAIVHVGGRPRHGRGKHHR